MDRLDEDPGRPEPSQTTDDGLSPDARPAIDDADVESFADNDTVNDPAQDADDADPTAPQKPPFEDDADLPANPSHRRERQREIEGNRGPDEVPGFGQGA